MSAPQTQQNQALQVIEGEVTQFSGLSREKIELLKRTICKGATDDELELAQALVQRTRLDPFVRQIAFIKRWDGQLKRDVMTPQVTIDGARLLADRTKLYGGQLGPWWCGEDGVWLDVWVKSAPPTAAKVGVIRTDWKDPLFAVARFDAYAARKADGGLIALWHKMPDLMIAKCAEMLALRRAFPAELSGIYSEDEMQQAANSSPAGRADVVHADADGGAGISDWTAFWTRARAAGVKDAVALQALTGRDLKSFGNDPQAAWDALTAAKGADAQSAPVEAPIEAEFVDVQTGEIVDDQEIDAEAIQWRDRVESAHTDTDTGRAAIALGELITEAGDDPARWDVLLALSPTQNRLNQIRGAHIKTGAKTDERNVTTYGRRASELKAKGQSTK